MTEQAEKTIGFPINSGSALFELVVHAAWADERIAAEEVSAARAAARLLHPHGEEGARGRLALGPETSLGETLRPLSGREAALGYALATWVMLADGVQSPKETAMLDTFRLLTGVPRDLALHLRRAVCRARVAQPNHVDAQLRSILGEISMALGRGAQPKRRTQTRQSRTPIKPTLLRRGRA
ncbi:MAG: hypothetical protein IPK82_41265 [Polyangiaceae bacterium]|nr:hypothetical protein [Polyangiaceae bacterium]